MADAPIEKPALEYERFGLAPPLPPARGPGRGQHGISRGAQGGAGRRHGSPPQVSLRPLGLQLVHPCNAKEGRRATCEGTHPVTELMLRI